MKRALSEIKFSEKAAFLITVSADQPQPASISPGEAAFGEEDHKELSINFRDFGHDLYAGVVLCQDSHRLSFNDAAFFSRRNVARSSEKIVSKLRAENTSLRSETAALKKRPLPEGALASPEAKRLTLR